MTTEAPDKEPETYEEVFETFASDTEAALAKVTPEMLADPIYRRYVDSIREATRNYRAVSKLVKAGDARAAAGLMPLRPCDLCDACLQPLTGPHCCTCGLASPK